VAWIELKETRIPRMSAGKWGRIFSGGGVSGGLSGGGAVAGGPGSTIWRSGSMDLKSGLIKKCDRT
jgi:hypothetical protein